MSRTLEIVLDQPAGSGVERHIADFPALALDGEVGGAFPVLDVSDSELGELLAAKAVIEKCGENRPIPCPLQALLIRRLEELSGLAVAERRSFAFVGAFGRPFDAVHGIVGHGIPFAEIAEQR